MTRDLQRSVQKDSLGAEYSEDDLAAAAVLARVGGNVRLLQEVAEMFLEDVPKWMAEIRGLIDRGDASGLRYSAHHLRGSVGNFGESAAYERARQLEALARTGDLTCAADVYSLLEEAICQFQQALSQLMHKPVCLTSVCPDQGVESPRETSPSGQINP